MSKVDAQTRLEANSDAGSKPPAYWLPKIEGRECIPVRLLPFLTNWWPLSPDKIAEVFGAGEAINRGSRRWRISSYVLRPGGSYQRVLPGRWADIADRLKALENELRTAERGDKDSETEWERRSIELMPSAVFVWRDELTAEFERTYGRHTFLRSRPGARELSESEQTEELQHLIDSADSAFEEDDLDRASKDVIHLEKELIHLEGDGSLNFEPVLSHAESDVVYEGFAFCAAVASRPEVAQVPAVPVPAALVADEGPLPLTTGDIAFCFNGLRWTADKWKKPLGDKVLSLSLIRISPDVLCRIR